MPAPIIYGGGDRFWKWSKMVEFPTFMGSWPWPWIRAWSLVTFFISHRVLHVYQISSKSKKLFVDGRTDGKLPPIVLGRLPKFGSRPKNVCLNGLQWKNKFDLIWSSITLSNCSDNVKTMIQETNWDSCPIQAELVYETNITEFTIQYRRSQNFFFPPKISMTQLAPFPPRFGRPCRYSRWSSLVICNGYNHTVCIFLLQQLH